MPPIIHCVRHGQGVHNLSYANHDLPDPELTPLGEEQARALTSRPELANTELIVSSPLRRTIQTALLAFPSKLKAGMQVLAWAEVQEASDLICDTGSRLPDIKARFDGLPVDFSLVEPDWYHKGKWAPTAACLLERAQLARQWLSERPEAEIVVISHGCFLHFLTDDWVNAINPQATDWGNAEVRSFTFASDISGGCSLDETEESRMRRGCQQLALTKEQQLELRDTVLETWIEWGVTRG
ncbi:histidine phosphatase clade-1 [Fusarium globosum]|uniref:Histidine phosphatase clade-1 n=1 Tax=Fusarium globosum TaxID=78864 RepID=A0A8H6D4N6_9HYPO|nr:histidine phosphatase clade-1 [Fusarium globosum]